MKYITISEIPFDEAFLMNERFVLLNMYPDGIWYVDKEHPDWSKIKETAIYVANTFGDTEQLIKLNNEK